MPISFFTIKLKLFEIWNHSGFQRYFKNTGWMFVSKFGTMLFSFLSSILIVRYLQPSQYGALNYAISFVGLFSFLTTLGLENILYRELVKDPERQYELLGTTFVLRIAGACLSFALLFIITFLLHLDAHLRILISVIAFSFFFQPFVILNFYFQAKVQSRILAINGFFVIISLSLIKILLVILHAPLILFAFVLIFEPIFFTITYLIPYRKLGNKILSWRYNKYIAKNMLRDSWPLMFSSAFTMIYSRIDQIMIGQYLNNFSVGIYSVAAQLSEYWYFIPIGIITSLTPAIINGYKTNLGLYKKRIKNLAMFIVLLVLSVIIIFTIFAKQIIVLIYGMNYINSVTVLKIYIWSGLGMSLGFVVNQLLIIENRTNLYFISNFLSMLINVVLNFLLIPRYGINGAAFATLIAYSIIPLPYIILRKKHALQVL